MPSNNQRVGEYILQSRIAAGTFGEVWRACHHVWSDQLVAVKIPTDPQYLRTLQREGIAIHGLEHPHIVRALGFDPYADPPYLAMEYVPGTSLRPYIQKRQLSVDDAVKIMHKVLAALQHAHERDLVHRDIKPENILIHERAGDEGFEQPGMVKVTDFGLGRAASASAAAGGAGSIIYSASMNDPAAREIAGTLEYMSPEQRNGGNVDGRSDLYACGVVLFEMLTGERPAGTDVPSDLNRAVPPRLDDVFRRSYARLDKRFGSAKEFLEALPRPGAQPPPLPRTAGPVAAHPRHQCPSCRGRVDPSDQFCMQCGVQLVENVRRCPRCGSYPDATDQFCIFCGQTLALPAASA